MATMTITLPDPIAQRVLDAICEVHGYNPDNPDHGSKAAFAKQQVINWLRTNTINHESGKAGAVARDEARVELETTITGIS